MPNQRNCNFSATNTGWKPQRSHKIQSWSKSTMAPRVRNDGELYGTWSVPRVVMIWDLIFWSALKDMFMRPHTPLSRRLGSNLWVSWQSWSTAPATTEFIGTYLPWHVPTYINMNGRYYTARLKVRRRKSGFSTLSRILVRITLSADTRHFFEKGHKLTKFRPKNIPILTMISQYKSHTVPRYLP